MTEKERLAALRHQWNTREISQEEFDRRYNEIRGLPEPTKRSSAPESVAAAVSVGAILLVFGAVGFAASVESGGIGLLLGVLAMVVGTLFLGAGVIAYGVRIGITQAYYRMRIGPYETEDASDDDSSS